MEFTPHKYQKYCIDRMLEDPALGLMLDMGLGKTVITLTAIQDLLFNRFAVNKVLIIAPKKVAEATWTDEVEKWEHLKDLRCSLVLGSAKKRIEALETPAEIYVINRENVQWLVERVKFDWDFDMVVIDEWSSFKNPQSKRFKYLKMVRDKISRIVGLTGTPAPNGLEDLWAQVYLLDKGERLEKNITAYRVKYFEPDARNATTIFSYKLKTGSEEIIKEKISDICISMKSEDYLSLPEVTYNEIPVAMDAKAMKKYQEMEKEMYFALEEEEITAASAASLTGKLLQMSNGAVYDAERNVHELHRCKIDAFLELVESLQGKPALVFYAFQHDLTRILAALPKKLRVRVLQSPEDQKDWNAGKIDILLAHPASAAYGLNLQAGGNHVIWFGLTWSLELYQQANKRVHRQGQKERVFVHHLVTKGTRDSDVIRALRDKGETQDLLLNSLKARIREVKEGSKK